MITPLQREARIAGIGSSDAAAILGFNPYLRASDVQLIKLGLVQDEPEPDYGPVGTADLALIGQSTEGAVAELAAKCRGIRLVKPTATYRHDSGVLQANVDRQEEKAARGYPPWELKDSGLDEGWGEPGTDQVPPMVLIQNVHQQICCGAKEGRIARLGRGFKRGLFIYDISETDDIKRLKERMETFLPAWWQRHIVNQDPLPADAPPPNFDALRRLRREPETTVPIDGSLVLAWRQAEEEAKSAIEARDELKARVIAALGTSEGGTCEHGTVTFLEQSRKGYFVEPATYRVCRWKPAK